MEKSLRTALAVFGLLTSAAWGKGKDASHPDSVVAVALTDSQLVASVRNATAAAPAVDFSSQGTGELLGAAIIGVGALARAARRRGLI